MGLDMFLSLNIDLGCWRPTEEINGKFNDAINKTFPFLKSDKPADFRYQKEVGYWRKANQIHHWFVTNVQNGKDDCGSYRVELEQLEELKKTCEEVLKDNTKAEELLPCQGGFFFGSTDYGSYYISDLEHTLRIIDTCLNLAKELEEQKIFYDFKYHASW